MSDFEKAIERDMDEVQRLLERIADTRAKLIDAEKNTRNLLEIAASAGVTAIGIGKVGEDFGLHWTFGTSGSIFTPEGARINGFPAAWHIAGRAGISQGAGNTGQHQADTSQLIDGVYECRGGMWRRTDLGGSHD